MYPSKSHIISCLFLFAIAFSAAAQNPAIDSRIVESRTYALYLKKDWKTLVAVGDSALDQGTDYYYLRSRMGIAYFSLGKYYTAIKHFKKAIEFNPIQELPGRYLSLSYLYTGQYEKSRKAAVKLSAYSQELILFKEGKILNYIGFNPGFKFSKSTDINTANLLGFNVGHYLFKQVSFNHSFSTYNQKGDFWDFGQKDYFAQGNIPLGKEYLLSLSYHYLFSTTTLDFTTFQQEYNSQAYAASAIVSKQVGKHNFSIGTTGLEVDSTFQMQHDLGYAYFPLDNNKLSFGAKGYLHTSDFYTTSYLSVLPYASFRPTKKLSFFASYLNSRGNNIAEWNGAILNNSPDLTTTKITLSSNYQLAKKWHMSLTYEREQKESETITDYNYNSIFLSLKYTPL
ncbi:MAG: tetratricopeptide (TPR) repeat protein [Glaciecola sp.]|jgi:tetratricopeptide (TPR) repeat protein